MVAGQTGLSGRTRIPEACLDCRLSPAELPYKFKADIKSEGGGGSRDR